MTNDDRFRKSPRSSRFYKMGNHVKNALAKEVQVGSTDGPMARWLQHKSLDSIIIISKGSTLKFLLKEWIFELSRKDVEKMVCAYLFFPLEKWALWVCIVRIFT